MPPRSIQRMPESDRSIPHGRIIERPRLTNRLDDSAGRLILLIAPAGYGKTTLAREWTTREGMRAVWYRGSREANDIAALATGVADSLEKVIPAAGRRMRRRLGGLPDPEADTSHLADLLARDLVEWPDHGWLVFDDYHFLSGSAACEQFIEILAGRAPLQLLIASRQRPSWVTARQIAYGELLELTREDLAMTDEEASRLLTSRASAEATHLTAFAAGWPAVLNLASRSADTDVSHDTLAAQLYDFFAEELFQQLTTRSQRELAMIAIAPHITPPILEIVAGDHATDLVTEAVEAGFFTLSQGSIDLHPLLREFLRSRTDTLTLDVISAVSRDLLNHFIAERLWDEAFLLVEAAPSTTNFITLLRPALPSLLNRGRVATIRHWLEFARSHSLCCPETDLAEAELSLRDGQPARSGFYAKRAAQDTSTPDRERSRALYLAGLSAQLTDDFEVGTAFFEQARKAATTREDLREALWGLFITTNDLELGEASQRLQELEAFLAHDDPDDVLRRATARFHSTARSNGSLRAALGMLSAARAVMEDATDPRVIARFVQTHPQCAMLVGEYQSALELGESAIMTLSQVGVDFPKLYVRLIRAYALAGLDECDRAWTLLSRLQHEVRTREDIYTLANLAVVRARLHLRAGDPEKAVFATSTSLPRRTCPGMAGELIATRALAHACLGDRTAADEAATEATATSGAVETKTGSLLARAISALYTHSNDAEQRVATALLHIRTSGHADGLNAAIRAYPGLAIHVPDDYLDSLSFEFLTTHLRGIRSTGKVAGSAYSDDNNDQLTHREREVLNLITCGFSNKEIAAHLYISIATVKVHIRHIFEKLGVRSRTEAAVKTATAIRRRPEQERPVPPVLR